MSLGIVMKHSGPNNRLNSTIASFIQYFRGLAPDALRPAPSAERGPREVLVHIVFWHEQYAAIAGALLCHQALPLQKGTFKQLNALAVKENSSCLIDELLRRLERAQYRLSELARSDNTVALHLSFREGSKLWPFEEAIDRIEKHIRGHQVKLRRRVR